MFTRLTLSSSLSPSRSYSTSTGPNRAIIDLLTRCLNTENSSPTRNGYKVRSYQVALAAIHQHDEPIRSGKDAIKLRGVGLGIANRIDFFLQGKEHDEGAHELARGRLRAVKAFQKIPGIGVQTATNLVNAGAMSVSDLQLPEYAPLLTRKQHVGVLYGEHIARPVSRIEAEEIAAFVRDHISCNFEVHLTGAYRRECDELPEVSILLHHNHHVHVPIPPPPPSSTSLAAAPKTTPVDPRGRQLLPFHRAFTSAAHRRASPFLQDVVRPLQAAAILVATLFDSVHKWHGIALLPLRAANADPDTGGTLGHAWQEVGDRMRDIRATRGRYLRLDLSLAPPKSRGAAQLILTGDNEFVRVARLAAERRGMYLDEYGLWRWHSPEEAVLEFQSQSNADTGGTQERPAESDAGDAPAAATGSGYWELVEGESEERILDELELGAIAPQRRNFRFLKKKERATARNGRLDFSPAEVGMEEGEG